MVEALESDLSQIVLGSGPFGPQEITHIVNAIAEDFSQYRVFRDAVAELEVRKIIARPTRFGWVFPTFCWGAIRRRSKR